MEAQLAKEIKLFRKQFHKQYGRDPSSKDMAKVPEVKATYDAWIALKSNQSASGSNAATTTNRMKQKKKKSRTDDSMPPPLSSAPITPRKKMSNSTQHKEEQRTPVRRRADGTKSTDIDMQSTIHDSGGSIVDVPTTPVLQQGRSVYHSALSPASPSETFSTPSRHSGRRADFDDGTSPSKLKNLIASFAATRSQSTPTKLSERRDDEDVRLAKRLDVARNGGSNGRRIQNGDLFTPRTKARKRLRGEIVVTPAKERQMHDSSIIDESTKRKITPTKVVRPSKRQRGMGTLRAFNFLPSGKNQTSNAAYASSFSLIQPNADEEEDDDDDDGDDDMVGPSPSARKIVDMPVASFRPLFSAQSVDEVDEDQDTEEETPLQSSQGAENDASDTALTTPAPVEDEGEVDSDEEERRLTRPYQRHGNPVRRRNEDEEDEDEEGVDEMPYGGAFMLRRTFLQRSEQEGKRASTRADDEDSGEDVAFGTLSITSPQCKRADRVRRQMQAKSVQHLLERNDDTAGLFDNEEEGGSEGQIRKMDDEKKKTTIAHGNAKTARMMRGTLTKAARKALALAEAKQEEALPNVLIAEEEERKTAVKPSNGDTSASARRSKLILRRGREEDDEEETEHDLSMDGAPGTSHSSFADDDEWASDVGSDEYGLGDGYMDEVDVV